MPRELRDDLRIFPDAIGLHSERERTTRGSTGSSNARFKVAIQSHAARRVRLLGTRHSRSSRSRDRRLARPRSRTSGQELNDLVADGAPLAAAASAGATAGRAS